MCKPIILQPPPPEFKECWFCREQYEHKDVRLVNDKWICDECNEELARSYGEYLADLRESMNK